LVVFVLQVALQMPVKKKHGLQISASWGLSGIPFHRF